MNKFRSMSVLTKRIVFRSIILWSAAVLILSVCAGCALNGGGLIGHPPKVEQCLVWVKTDYGLKAERC